MLNEIEKSAFDFTIKLMLESARRYKESYGSEWICNGNIFTMVRQLKDWGWIEAEKHIETVEEICTAGRYDILQRENGKVILFLSFEYALCCLHDEWVSINCNNSTDKLSKQNDIVKHYKVIICFLLNLGWTRGLDFYNQLPEECLPMEYILWEEKDREEWRHSEGHKFAKDIKNVSSIYMLEIIEIKGEKDGISDVHAKVLKTYMGPVQNQLIFKTGRFFSGGYKPGEISINFINERMHTGSFSRLLVKENSDGKYVDIFEGNPSYFDNKIIPIGHTSKYLYSYALKAFESILGK